MPALSPRQPASEVERGYLLARRRCSPEQKGKPPARLRGDNIYPVTLVHWCRRESRPLALEEGTPTLWPRQPASEVERAYLLPWGDASPPAVPVLSLIHI